MCSINQAISRPINALWALTNFIISVIDLVKKSWAGKEITFLAYAQEILNYPGKCVFFVQERLIGIAAVFVTEERPKVMCVALNVLLFHTLYICIFNLQLSDMVHVRYIRLHGSLSPWGEQLTQYTLHQPLYVELG